MDSTKLKFMRPHRILASLAVTAIASCSSHNNTIYSPPPTIQTQPSIPHEEIGAIDKDLPPPPEGGRIAFFGVKTLDCLSAVRGAGTYVSGYFFINGKSPSKTAGLIIGDKITKVNGRDGITSSLLSNYFKHVGRYAIYDFEIERERNNMPYKTIIQVRSEDKTEGVLTTTEKKSCKNIKLLEQ